MYSTVRQVKVNEKKRGERNQENFLRQKPYADYDRMREGWKEGENLQRQFWKACSRKERRQSDKERHKFIRQF